MSNTFDFLIEIKHIHNSLFDQTNLKKNRKCNNLNKFR